MRKLQSKIKWHILWVTVHFCVHEIGNLSIGWSVIKGRKVLGILQCLSGTLIA